MPKIIVPSYSAGKEKQKNSIRTHKGGERMFGWFATGNADYDKKNEKKIYGAKFGCKDGCRHLKNEYGSYRCACGENLVWGIKSACKYFEA